MGVAILITIALYISLRARLAKPMVISPSDA